jgi:hypothetical protein
MEAASLLIFCAGRTRLIGIPSRKTGACLRARPPIYRHRAGFGKGCRKPTSLRHIERKWFRASA